MPIIKASFRLTLMAASMASAISTSAQVPAANNQAPSVIPPIQQVEILGSTAAYDPRRDDTASRIVVGRAELAKYGDANVLDVLKRVPGVTVNGGSGRASEIRMRGLGAGYTQILIDGERAPPGFSLESLAPDVIDRIEILRAATADYSAQSVAGTVNIVLRKAVKNRQRELKAGARRGSGITGANASLQLSDRAGTFSYSVAANATHDDIDRWSTRWDEAFDASGNRYILRDSVVPETGDVSTFNLTPRLNLSLANGDTLSSQSLVNLSRRSSRFQTSTNTALGPCPN